MKKIKMFYGVWSIIEKDINEFLEGVTLIDLKQSIDDDPEVSQCYALVTIIYK